MRDNPNVRRLEDLFPRYWDSALTSPELAELSRILAADPEARRSFLMLGMQVVAPAELSAIATHLPAPPPASSEGWSRRRLLRFAGGGFAAGLAGLAGGIGWRLSRGPEDGPVFLEAVRGLVRLGGADATAGARLPHGAMLRSVGPSSSARLALPDGSTVSITGDSALGVERRGLTLHEGNATADVRPRGGAPVVLGTSAATLESHAGATVTLGSDLRATEVGVQAGRVRVSNRSGDLVDEVREGEILTLRPGGESNKQQVSPTPTSFRWDLRRPLPDGWAVGHRVGTDAGPAVQPEFWYDPYHSAVLSQVRSDNQWTRGFVTLHPDSVIRVRYRVDRPGRGQLVFVVRTARPDRPTTGVVEVNDAFVDSRPGEWQWLEARPRDMLDNKEAPLFGPPWVGFLIIFNTYEVDLGLRIADLRVSRNGGALNG